MNRVFFRKIVAFSALVLCALFSGCSGSSNSGYKIGVDPMWFPLDLIGKEANVLAFVNELLMKVSSETGYEFSRVNASWDNLLEGVNTNRFDGALTSMYPYVFNESKYYFSDLVFSTGPVLVMGEGVDPKYLDGLYEKEIAVLGNSDETTLIECYPDALVRPYPNALKALTDTALGEIDGVLMENIQASAFVSDAFKNQLKIVSKPLNNAGVRLVSSKKESKKIIEVFNKGLSRLEHTGELEKLLEKWKISL